MVLVILETSGSGVLGRAVRENTGCPAGLQGRCEFSYSIRIAQDILACSLLFLLDSNLTRHPVFLLAESRNPTMTPTHTHSSTHTHTHTLTHTHTHPLLSIL